MIDGVGMYTEDSNSGELNLSNRQLHLYDIGTEQTKVLNVSQIKESFNSDDVRKIKQELNDYFTNEPVDERYITFVAKQRTS